MDFPKTAFLIIDMQNDVIKKLGETGTQIVPKIQKALEIARQKNLPIIHILRVHRKNGSDVELFRCQLFEEKPFLVEGSEGAQTIDSLKPLSEEYIVEKKRFSGFFQSDLLMILMRLNVNAVAICGVQTPNCIRATVTDAIAYDFDVTVLEDATAAQTEAIHQANLLDMRNMGAHVLTVGAFFNP